MAVLKEKYEISQTSLITQCPFIDDAKYFEYVFVAPK